jgi:hypothetical protein
VRVAAPKGESVQQRVTYAVLGVGLAIIANSVWPILKERDSSAASTAATVAATAQHAKDIDLLKVQMATIGPAVTRLEIVVGQLTELKSQLSASVADRYTSTQAAIDRTSVTDRLARVEACSDDLLLFRARVEEWMRTRGGPTTSTQSSALFGAVIP